MWLVTCVFTSLFSFKSILQCSLETWGSWIRMSQSGFLWKLQSIRHVRRGGRLGKMLQGWQLLDKSLIQCFPFTNMVFPLSLHDPPYISDNKACLHTETAEDDTREKQKDGRWGSVHLRIWSEWALKCVFSAFLPVLQAVHLWCDHSGWNRDGIGATIVSSTWVNYPFKVAGAQAILKAWRQQLPARPPTFKPKGHFCQPQHEAVCMHCRNEHVWTNMLPVVH